MANPRSLAFNIGAAALAVLIVGGIVYFRGSRKEADRGVFFAEEEIRPTPTLTPLPAVIEEEIEEPLIAPPTPSSATPIAPPEFSERYQEQMREKAREVHQEKIRVALREYIAMAENHRQRIRELLTDAIMSDLEGRDDDSAQRFEELQMYLTEQRLALMPKLLEEGSRDRQAMSVHGLLGGMSRLIGKADDIFTDRSRAAVERRVDEEFRALDEALEELKKMANP